MKIFGVEVEEPPRGNECGHEWMDEHGDHVCGLREGHAEYYHLSDDGFVSVRAMIEPRPESTPVVD